MGAPILIPIVSTDSLVFVEAHTFVVWDDEMIWNEEIFILFNYGTSIIKS